MAAGTCGCGNKTGEGETSCDWCIGIEAAKEAQTRPHSWQEGWITGVTTCQECGLLPTDPLDSFSDCPGRQGTS